MSEVAEEPVTEVEEPDEASELETEEAEPGAEESPDGELSEALGEEDEPITEEAVAAANDAPPADDVDAIARVRELDKMERSLEKRASAYVLAVDSYVTTTEQPFIRCGCCMAGLPGFLVSPAVAAPSDDQVKFARALAGMPEQPPLVQGANIRECPACEGWGDVLTGSKRNDQTKIRCATCQGRGYVGEGPQAAALHVAPVPFGDPPPADVAPEDTPQTDPWGRPAEHPGYMIMPHAGMDDALKPPGWAA